MYDVPLAGTVLQVENLTPCSHVTLDEYQLLWASEAIVSLAFRGGGHASPLLLREEFGLVGYQVVVAMLNVMASPVSMYTVSVYLTSAVKTCMAIISSLVAEPLLTWTEVTLPEVEHCGDHRVEWEASRSEVECRLVSRLSFNVVQIC